MEQVEEVYHTALSLNAAERATFVVNASAGDTALYEEVMSLLTADDKAAGFLHQSAFSRDSTSAISVYQACAYNWAYQRVAFIESSRFVPIQTVSLS